MRHLYYIAYPPELDGARWVKIGRAKVVTRRVTQLQIGSPYPLEVLAVAWGEGRRERAVHAAFAQYRGSGEWFRLPTELCARCVEEVHARFPAWRDALLAEQVVARTDRYGKLLQRLERLSPEERAAYEQKRTRRERACLRIPPKNAKGRTRAEKAARASATREGRYLMMSWLYAEE